MKKVKINNKIDEMSAKIEQNKIITIKNKIEKVIVYILLLKKL